MSVRCTGSGRQKIVEALESFTSHARLTHQLHLTGDTGEYFMLMEKMLKPWDKYSFGSFSICILTLTSPDLCSCNMQATQT